MSALTERLVAIRDLPRLSARDRDALAEAANRLAEIGEDRCIKHGAYNAEGDCIFCDKEQAQEALEDVARWFALTMVADEIASNDPVPHALREPVARAMVREEMMGWPDVEAALRDLDNLYDWTPE